MPTILRLCLFLSMIACVHSREAEKTKSLKEALDLAGRYQIVFLGEQHDNPQHHRIQAEFIQTLARQSRLAAVFMEHLLPDQGQTLADTPSSSWQTNLAWEKSGWPSYEIFQPIFSALAENQVQVIGVGLPRSSVRLLYKGNDPGYLSNADKEQLGLNSPLPKSADKALQKSIITAHCGYLDESSAQPMISMQRYKDAFMASQYFSTTSSPKKSQKIVLYLVGSGHARNDFGAPYYLRHKDENLKILSLLLQEEGTEKSSTAPFDYAIPTGAFEREDPCSKFKDSLKKAFPSKSRDN